MRTLPRWLRRRTLPEVLATRIATDGAGDLVTELVIVLAVAEGIAEIDELDRAIRERATVAAS